MEGGKELLRRIRKGEAHTLSHMHSISDSGTSLLRPIVLIREVSLFQRLICTQKYILL